MMNNLEKPLAGLRQMPSVGAPILIVVVLAMLLLPIPPIGLDVLFTVNIVLSLVVLLVAIYTPLPLKFSSFPSVLLIATMLRLALNIASTRVVLQNGHTGTASAGNVIQSFGDFVIGGNYAVGIVVFTILVIINFVVVTKGAGRVSEVTARFTLDAMPGKQMAIDADLNAGIIDQDEAKSRREMVSQEADFYGSMDGASKFVRGDAVAGVLILIINFIGGLAIGVGQYQLGFAQAAQNYSLLTIGDGLAAQIPSLLLSTATALIVTRASGEQDMSDQVVDQLLVDNRAIVTASLIIGALGLVPGMPNLMFLGISAVLAFVAYRFRSVDETPADSPAVDEDKKPSEELSWGDVSVSDIVSLELGYKLIHLVDETRGGTLPDRVRGVRRKLTEEIGFLMHPVHIRDDLDLDPGQYRIRVNGIIEGDAVIYPDKEMALDPGGASGSLHGTPGQDPAFGMQTTWIEPALRDRAESMGYTVVDASTVIATHMSKILRGNVGRLFGHDEAQQWLDKLSAVSPKLVDDLVPTILSLTSVVKVLRNLLDDGIPIKDMRSIAEAMAAFAPVQPEVDPLTECVRVALRRLITDTVVGSGKTIDAITIDSQLEQLWQQSMAASDKENSYATGLGMEPGLAERFYQSLAESAEKQQASGNPSVLLVSPQIRPWLAGMIRHSIPTLKVLSYSEIADDREIRVVANIGGASHAEMSEPAAA